MTTKANEVRTTMQVALKIGNSFAEAAKTANAKLEAYPVFSVSEELKDQPDFGAVAQSASELPQGEMSELVTTPEGALLLCMEKREPLDDSKFQKELDAQWNALRMRKRFTTFFVWLQNARKTMDLQSLQEAPRRG
jgi:hypothetical protein